MSVSSHTLDILSILSESNRRFNEVVERSGRSRGEEQTLRVCSILLVEPHAAVTVDAPPRVGFADLGLGQGEAIRSINLCMQVVQTAAPK